MAVDSTPTGISRRHLLLGAGAGAGLLALQPGAAAAAVRTGAAAAAAGGLAGLEIFTSGHPRVFHFRGSEFFAGPRGGGVDYATWERTFTQLNGIMGKALLEENLFRVDDQVLEFFTRYKRRNPEKIVLLHFNGEGRDPRLDGEEFFAGHWLHREGTRLTRAASAAAEDTVLHVADTSVFDDRAGLAGGGDEVAVVLTRPDGSPDWSRVEQVKVLAVDRAASTIRVERGFLWSFPMELPVGTYLAAHTVNGPYGRGSNLLWGYNYSTASPRDADGGIGLERFAENVARRFRPGGELELFDGIEFDVMPFSQEVGYGGVVEDNPVDADGDGVADGGFVGDLNAIGVGTTQFAALLRTLLGPDKLIMADGAVNNQRPNFAAMNGIESEGWPSGRDLEQKDWSGGLNRHAFWAQHGAPPAFPYMNYKDRYQEGNNLVNYPKWRLTLAAGLFTDSYFTVQPNSSPPPEEGEEDLLEVPADELRRGTDYVYNWLGAPVGEAVHLAQQAPDLLEGGGVSWNPRFRDRLSHSGLTLERRTGGGASPRLVISCTDCENADDDGGDLFDPPLLPPLVRSTYPVMRLSVPVPEHAGPDLFLRLTLRGEALQEYPEGIGRRVKVVATNTATGASQLSSTLCSEQSFTATWYFRDIGSGPHRVDFEFESGLPLTLERLTAHGAPDLVYRDYEHGAVFANPSSMRQDFDIGALLPGRMYQRLDGSPSQDPVTNSGEAVGAVLEVPARDALLVRTAE